ncbi:MAG: DNA-binding protein WhiA [Ruminococcaceae bacterium]|nr:DNA-binding protein WhiA [Oscillospiraceae bacterium]
MSFSSEIKTSVSAVNIKRPCCRASVLYGMLYSLNEFKGSPLNFSTDNESVATLFTAMTKSVFGTKVSFTVGERLSRMKEAQNFYRLDYPGLEIMTQINEKFASQQIVNEEIFKCEACAGAFMRGLFLASGSVTDPSHGYHLEFSVSNDKKCFALMEYLNENGFPARRTVRRGVPSLYIKESESIEDFMTFIGAAQASLTIMNAKIMRDIRNNVNRRMNCDSANLYKTTGAATHQIHAIKHLMDTGRFEFMPDQLKETAKIRLENPQASLEELASLHEGYISKSGVSHRLAKIVDFDDSKK